MALTRLLFVISTRAGVWSAPGLEPTDAHQQVIGLDGWCAWRLVGGNNREIARSSVTYETFQECFEAARRVQLGASEAKPTLRHDDVQNLWAWRLQIDETAGASSGRMYHRYRECVFNAGQFVTSMPTAVSSYDAATLIPAPRGVSESSEIWLPESDRADAVLI